MQGTQLFLSNLYFFLEFVCVYFATILGFCAIMSVFVTGIILILRSTVFSKHIFGRAALWCLLIPVIFCGKLHMYYQTYVGFKLFYWWYELCVTRWISVLYCAGIAVTGLVFITKRKRLRRRVDHFYDSKRFSSKYTIKEYPGQVSSFCTGCIKPVIVIPEDIDDSRLFVVIRHEETHIRLGHLWILLAYDILRTLLWPNILLHICVRFFKRDLEDVCDAVTIQRGRINAYDYGEAIIGCAKDMLDIRKKLGLENGMSFAVDDSFMALRKRLERIACHKAYNTRTLTALIVVTIMLVVAGIGLVKAGSYEKINYNNEISSVCFSNNFNDISDIFVDYDKSVVTGYDDEYIYVDADALFEKYPEARTGGGYFYFSVGGYYKIPGIGGGGGWGEIDAGDISSGTITIINHTEIDIWNRIIMWL